MSGRPGSALGIVRDPLVDSAGSVPPSVPSQAYASGRLPPLEPRKKLAGARGKNEPTPGAVETRRFSRTPEVPMFAQAEAGGGDGFARDTRVEAAMFGDWFKGKPKESTICCLFVGSLKQKTHPFFLKSIALSIRTKRVPTLGGWVVGGVGGGVLFRAFCPFYIFPFNPILGSGVLSCQACGKRTLFPLASWRP